MRRPLPFWAALLAATVVHGLVLALLDPKAAQAAPASLRVTLSVAPGRAPAPKFKTRAIASQIGDDRSSRKQRSPAVGPRVGAAGVGARNRQEQGRNHLARPSYEGVIAGDDARRRPPAQATHSRAVPGRIRAARGDPRAAYLSAWKQRIEARGSHQFPAAADHDGGRLTIEVTLAPDGGLLGARILRGSGQPALDAAALDILRTAAPFPPFPPLPPTPRGHGAALTFAYIWRFEPGTTRRLAVD